MIAFPAERPRPGASWTGRFLRLPPLPDLPPAQQEVQGYFQKVHLIRPIVFWNLPAGFVLSAAKNDREYVSNFAFLAFLTSKSFYLGAPCE